MVHIWLLDPEIPLWQYWYRGVHKPRAPCAA
jgi:hypothetical protein